MSSKYSFTGTSSKGHRRCGPMFGAAPTMLSTLDCPSKVLGSDRKCRPCRGAEEGQGRAAHPPPWAAEWRRCRCGGRRRWASSKPPSGTSPAALAGDLRDRMAPVCARLLEENGRFATRSVHRDGLL